MKRIICVIMAIVMVCASAFALEIDWMALSDEELGAVLVGAQEEAARRAGAAKADAGDGVLRIVPGTVLLDDAGVRVTVDSEIYEQFGMMVFDIICVNDSGHGVMVSAEDVYVNDWASMMSGCTEMIDAGKKAKGVFLLMGLDDVGVGSAEDIDCVECVMYACDMDTWDDVTEKVKLKMMP